eukprot:1151034-Alexandrium_andersonii.AAC.1
MVHACARVASARRLREPRDRGPRAARDSRRWGAPARRQHTLARQESPPGRPRLHWAAHCPYSPRA